MQYLTALVVFIVLAILDVLLFCTFIGIFLLFEGGGPLCWRFAQKMWL